MIKRASRFDINDLRATIQGQQLHLDRQPSSWYVCLLIRAQLFGSASGHSNGPDPWLTVDGR